MGHLLAGNFSLESGMTKFEERRIALQNLVNGFGRGGIAKVAEAIGKEPNYVSRMLYPEGKKGAKRIGEDSVELITHAYPFWLTATKKEAEPTSATRTSPALTELISRKNHMSEGSQRVLQLLVTAAQKDALSEQDWSLIEELARRFIREGKKK